jgi:glycosyltransferase involved in cell wall biosynthesis
MKISISIPSYNRSEIVFQNIQKIINNKKVDEIIVNDDFSDENIFLELKRKIESLKSEKIKIFRNTKNLGAFLNKIESIKKSSNDWVILLDSDNSINDDYFENIPENLNNKCIYMPSHAMCDSENLNYKTLPELNNFVYKKDFFNLIFNENIKYQCLLNTGNYLINKNKYLETIQSEYNILNPYASDVIYFLYLWFKNNENSCFYLVENMTYNHYLHSNNIEEGSFYVKNSIKSQEFINFLKNEIKNNYGN